MKSYQELLSTTDWRSKRYSIISRDKNQCVHCDNSTYLKENKSGDIINGVLSYQIGDYINKSKFVKNWYKVSVAESNTTYIYHNGTLKPVHEAMFSSYDYFAPERLKELHVVYEETEPIKIVCVADSGADCIIWLYVHNLHVHHKYYQDEKLPWQYPNTALVTLCWSCHEELHKHGTVPWLDKDGNMKGRLSNCGKCHGAGYIAKYAHVENGVCFECNGKRFKELVNNSNA